MEHVGIDLGKKGSQVAVITESGELIERRMRTERDRLRQFFATRPRAKVLMEASTISEWVARLLEEVEAYLGLVPREWSSSEIQRRGHITKAGNSRLRWLLAEVAWGVSTHKKWPQTLALREWAGRPGPDPLERLSCLAPPPTPLVPDYCPMRSRD